MEEDYEDESDNEIRDYTSDPGDDEEEESDAYVEDEEYEEGEDEKRWEAVLGKLPSVDTCEPRLNPEGVPIELARKRGCGFDFEQLLGQQQKRRKTKKAQNTVTLMTSQGYPLPKVYLGGADCDKLLTPYPKSWNHACYYDCHDFSGPPVGLPTLVRKHRQLYIAVGYYCSLACLVAEAERRPNSSQLIPLIHQMAWGVLGYPKGTPIRAALPRQMLKMFGGTLDIEEWRAKSRCPDTKVERVPLNVVFDPEMVAVIHRKQTATSDKSHRKRQRKLRAKEKATKAQEAVPLPNPEDALPPPPPPRPQWEAMYKKIHGHRPSRETREELQAEVVPVPPPVPKPQKDISHFMHITTRSLAT